MTWERIGLNDAVDNSTDTTLGTYQKGTSQATASAAAPPSPPPPPLGNTMEHSRYLPTMEGRKTNSWSKLRGAVKATSVLSGASSKQNMQPSKVYASRGGAAASGGGGSLSSKEAANNKNKFALMVRMSNGPTQSHSMAIKLYEKGQCNKNIQMRCVYVHKKT